MNTQALTRAYSVLGVAASILLVVLGALFFELTSIRTLYQEAAVHAQTLAATLSEQESFKKARAALLETATQREKIAQYFTPEARAVEFIEEIESLGVSLGLVTTLSSIDIVATPVPQLTLSIRAEGEWQNVMHYLALIEAMPRRIEIRQASLLEIPSDQKIKRWRAAYDIILLSFEKTQKK